MAKIVKSFRLDDREIWLLQELRKQKPFTWPEKLESESDVIGRLIREESNRQRNTKLPTKT